MNQLVTIEMPTASALTTLEETELAAAKSFAEMEKSAGTSRVGGVNTRKSHEKPC